MKIDAEKIKKWWPVALLLLATSVIGGLNSSFDAVSRIFNYASEKERRFEGRICNDTVDGCSEGNRAFSEFLIQNVGQEVSISVRYNASGYSVFQDQCQSWSRWDERWGYNGVNERDDLNAYALGLPEDGMPCDNVTELAVPRSSLRLAEDMQGIQNYAVSGRFFVGYTKAGMAATFILSESSN